MKQLHTCEDIRTKTNRSTSTFQLQFMLPFVPCVHSQDFGKSFRQQFSGVGILYKKKAPPPPNLFSFLLPLSIEVWIYMTTAYLGVSILMFLLAR